MARDAGSRGAHDGKLKLERQLGLAVALAAGPLEAQIPAGAEFRVNTYTTGAQRSPSIAREPDGDFVLVWESTGQDGSQKGIFGQRYAASGGPQGGEFTTREQMVVFLLVTKEGAGYAPPACVPPNMFDDVPETSPFCRWIEELARRGVVAGCSANPPLFCPSSAVTREQMAVFLSATFGLQLYGP